MNPTIAYIRSSALHWMSYRLWLYGDPEIRGFEMHKAMRDIVMAGVLYRVEARKRRALS